MRKLLTTLAALTVIAPPAFAQSFDPDNGTGNIVLSLASKPTAPLSDKLQSVIAGYVLTPWFRAPARLT
jgi:hypothetical protein